MDWSKVKDLYDEDEILGEMKKEGFEEEPAEKPVNKRVKKLRQK